MARVLVTHPSPVVRDAHRTLLQACGWTVTEAANRRDALTQLAGPSSRRFGDMVLVDLANWTVAGTALIRHLRHQLASTLPVLAVLPPLDEHDLALEAASRAGANLVLSGQVSPRTLATAVSLLTGQKLPGLARLAVDLSGEALDVGDVWHQQQLLLGQANPAAATVVSARQVFELLLSRRVDAGATDAALALTQMAGGPVPLQRWSLAHDPECPPLPARAQPQPPVYTAMLVVDAGGQVYGLPLDGPVGPGSWWTDGPNAPTQAPTALRTVPLVRLLGPTGFRRLLATDRATVVLSHHADPVGTELAVRVDDLQGLQHVVVQPCSDILRQASGCVGTGHCADGQPVLVLDAAALWRHVAAFSQPAEPKPSGESPGGTGSQGPATPSRSA